MSSPITFSGFNNIDFGSILNILMAQAKVPRDTLATQQTALQTKTTAFGTLATKLSSLSSSSDNLTSSTVTTGRTATSSDATVVSASAANGAVAGTYDIVVNALAHAQVTVSTAPVPPQSDANTTVVADGGTLKIGTTATVDLTGKSLTLQGLADAINATADTGVTASVISPTAGTYALMLTGNATGATSSFALTNSLTLGGGASKMAFAGNAMAASDADITVNNVSIKSATNTITGGAPGTTLTLLKKTAAGDSVTVNVSKSSDSTKTQVQGFVDAYNELVTFIQAQGTGTDAIGRDPLLQSMWSSLRSTINSSYTAGGTQTTLASVGVGFLAGGKLSLDTSALDTALASSESNVAKLFGGDGVNAGVFSSLRDIIDSYADSGGLINSTMDRLDAQVLSMNTQLANMDARLETKRLALQQEFTAADSLMSQLTSSAGSLTNLGNQYRLF
ncbi:MAG: flagellar filament capping protein FliD [Acidobacteriota bacterium]